MGGPPCFVTGPFWCLFSVILPPYDGLRRAHMAPILSDMQHGSAAVPGSVSSVGAVGCRAGGSSLYTGWGVPLPTQCDARACFTPRHSCNTILLMLRQCCGASCCALPPQQGLYACLSFTHTLTCAIKKHACTSSPLLSALIVVSPYCANRTQGMWFSAMPLYVVHAHPLT